jgi:hypothetical protein
MHRDSKDVKMTVENQAISLIEPLMGEMGMLVRRDKPAWSRG